MWSIEIMAFFCRVYTAQKYCVHNKCRCLEVKVEQELPERLNTALDMPAKPSGGITKIVCSQCIKKQ